MLKKVIPDFDRKIYLSAYIYMYSDIKNLSFQILFLKENWLFSHFHLEIAYI